MEKPECIIDYQNHELLMSDEKCKECPYLYECRFMIAEMTDITEGGF